MLATVQVQLHTTQDAATWVLTAYLVSASIATPILGRVGDMIGKERIFVVSLGAPTLGSLTARLGGKALVVCGCLTGGVSMGMLAFAHQREWEIYVSTALMGVGFGLAL